MKDAVEWALIRAVLPLAALPPRGRSAASWVAAFLAYDLARVRRSVVHSNLRRALGLQGRALRRVARGAYHHLALVALEVAVAARTSPEVMASVCRVEGEEHLRNLREEGRGAILVSGHLGNWEYLGLSLAVRGYPLTAVAARVRNARLHRWLTQLRARYGASLIPMGRGAVSACVDALRRGSFLMLLVDQDARRGGVFVDFFGIPASTHAGAAVLSLRTQAPMVPCRAVRTGGGYVTHVLPPLPPVRTLGEVTVRMQEVTSILEAWIREDPPSWLWLHRRFKTSPAG